MVPPPPPTVAAVILTPAELIIPEGEARTLTVSVFDQAAHPMANQTVTWSSNNPVVATVDPRGRVAALLPGSALIVAAVGDHADTSRITIPPAPIASIRLTPATAVIELGVTLDLVALVRDIFDRDVLLPLDWTSSNAAVVGVSPNGAVIGVGLGEVEIRATLNGVSGTAQVSVIPPVVAAVQVSPDSVALLVGESLPLAAEVMSGRGEVLTDRLVVWWSQLPGVVAVSETGQLQAVAVGGSWVGAEVEGVRDSAWVSVEPPPPAGYHLTITNHLLQSALFTIDGQPIITIGSGQQLRLFRAPESGMRAGWSLVRKMSGQGPVGEAVLDTFPPITGADGDSLELAIRAELTDGRRLVTPVLRNVIGTTVLIMMAQREEPQPCFCVVQSLGEDEIAGLGYWFLPVGQQLLIHRRADIGRTGPFLAVPVAPAEVDPWNGIWRYRIVTGP